MWVIIVHYIRYKLHAGLFLYMARNSGHFEPANISGFFASGNLHHLRIYRVVLRNKIYSSVEWFLWYLKNLPSRGIWEETLVNPLCKIGVLTKLLRPSFLSFIIAHAFPIISHTNLVKSSQKAIFYLCYLLLHTPDEICQVRSQESTPFPTITAIFTPIKDD